MHGAPRVWCTVVHGWSTHGARRRRLKNTPCSRTPNSGSRVASLVPDPPNRRRCLFWPRDQLHAIAAGGKEVHGFASSGVLNHMGRPGWSFMLAAYQVAPFCVVMSSSSVPSGQDASLWQCGMRALTASHMARSRSCCRDKAAAWRPLEFVYSGHYP